jgi:hypothetical protein
MLSGIFLFMTKEEWDNCDNMSVMMCQVNSERKLKLFMCACFRRGWLYLEEDVKRIITNIELGYDFDRIYFCTSINIGYISQDIVSIVFHATMHVAIKYADSLRDSTNDSWTYIFSGERNRQRRLFRHMCRVGAA